MLVTVTLLIIQNASKIEP